MDSGTSGGSMQSGSSGEDDQNDTSFSPAPLSIPRLNHHQAAAYTHLHQPIFTPQHLQYPPLTNSRSDDHMNLYPHLSSSNNSFLETLPQSDLDRVWSMGLNAAHPQSQQQMFYSAATSTSSLVAGASSSAMNNPNSQTTTHDPQLKPTGKLAPTTQPGKENGFSSGRVVKKRSRASRKTPTTVLTTDTTNFRAMVQEFTGIPTPPFGPSALFPAKKFDLFGTNNVLDPSLGSLLYSLNKSNNPNHNPFAPPLSHINTSTNNQNPAYQQPQQQQQQSQQMMMLPSGSNFQNQNPNQQAFHSSVLRPSSYPSKYSNAGGNEQVDHQLAGFSKGGENDNFSGTG
ncbi:unnamed protein product [Rhodiola kirilowii]